jgi:hypothetical protein
MTGAAFAPHTPARDPFGDKPKLVTMSPVYLMLHWRPGSHDTADGPEGANHAWTWTHEATDLFTRDRDLTLAILDRVVSEGIGFIDYAAPILLGNDGRVWDGHHRIVIAQALGYPFVEVEVV